MPAGKRALRVNLDETAICVFQGGGAKGNVFIDRSARAVLHATRGQRRTYLTHVALFCDDCRRYLLPTSVLCLLGNLRRCAPRARPT